MPSFLKRLQQSQRDRATHLLRVKSRVVHGKIVYEKVGGGYCRTGSLPVSSTDAVTYSCNVPFFDDYDRVLLVLKDCRLRIYVGKYIKTMNTNAMVPCPFAKKKTFESVNAALSFVTKMYFKTN